MAKKLSSKMAKSNLVKSIRIKSNNKLIERFANTNNRYFFLKGNHFKPGDGKKNELNYKDIKPIIEFLGYSEQDLSEVLEVEPDTQLFWEKENNENKQIGKLRSKNFSDIDQIIAKGIRIFGSIENFKNWLNTKNYAMGDKKPIDLMKDPFGLELVNNGLEALSWGSII